jgi:hypothetical protein
MAHVTLFNQSESGYCVRHALFDQSERGYSVRHAVKQSAEHNILMSSLFNTYAPPRTNSYTTSKKKSVDRCLYYYSEAYGNNAAE